MRRREPSDKETAQLFYAVHALAWQHARALSGLQDGEPPENPFDEALDETELQAALLSHLAALCDLRELAERQIAITVAIAGGTGTTAPVIGKVLGMTDSGVRKKYPGAVDPRPGPKRPTRANPNRVNWHLETMPWITAAAADHHAEELLLGHAKEQLSRHHKINPNGLPPFPSAQHRTRVLAALHEHGYGPSRCEDIAEDTPDKEPGKS
uniref:hypothetical protein n=1 Tax=Amycolatopsis sp. CA-096443 TaxID=3239919 RepID=UPI003F496E41